MFSDVCLMPRTLPGMSVFLEWSFCGMEADKGPHLPVVAASLSLPLISVAAVLGSSNSPAPTLPQPVSGVPCILLLSPPEPSQDCRSSCCPYTRTSWKHGRVSGHLTHLGTNPSQWGVGTGRPILGSAFRGYGSGGTVHVFRDSGGTVPSTPVSVTLITHLTVTFLL